MKSINKKPKIVYADVDANDRIVPGIASVTLSLPPKRRFVSAKGKHVILMNALMRKVITIKSKPSSKNQSFAMTILIMKQFVTSLTRIVCVRLN